MFSCCFISPLRCGPYKIWFSKILILRIVSDRKLQTNTCDNPCDSIYACLLEPSSQTLFTEEAPNALAPPFTNNKNIGANLVVHVCSSDEHITGLVDPSTGEKLTTSIYGYKVTSTDFPCTWPGATIIAQKDVTMKVTWKNKLPLRPLGHLLTNKVRPRI